MARIYTVRRVLHTLAVETRERPRGGCIYGNLFYVEVEEKSDQGTEKPPKRPNTWHEFRVLLNYGKVIFLSLSTAAVEMLNSAEWKRGNNSDVIHY